MASLATPLAPGGSFPTNRRSSKCLTAFRMSERRSTCMRSDLRQRCLAPDRSTFARWPPSCIRICDLRKCSTTPPWYSSGAAWAGSSSCVSSSTTATNSSKRFRWLFFMPRHRRAPRFAGCQRCRQESGTCGDVSSGQQHVPANTRRGLEGCQAPSDTPTCGLRLREASNLRCHDCAVVKRHALLRGSPEYQSKGRTRYQS